MNTAHRRARAELGLADLHPISVEAQAGATDDQRWRVVEHVFHVDAAIEDREVIAAERAQGRLGRRIRGADEGKAGRGEFDSGDLDRLRITNVEPDRREAGDGEVRDDDIGAVVEGEQRRASGVDLGLRHDWAGVGEHRPRAAADDLDVGAVAERGAAVMVAGQQADSPTCERQQGDRLGQRVDLAVAHDAVPHRDGAAAALTQRLKSTPHVSNRRGSRRNVAQHARRLLPANDRERGIKMPGAVWSRAIE